MALRRKKNKVFRKWGKRIAYKAVPLFAVFGRIFIRSLWATMRVDYQGDERALAILKSDQSFLMAFFHGRQFLLVRGMEGYRAAIMSSISFLGEVQSKILESFGYEVIRGSSSRGGARVLGEMIRLVRKGRVGALAVDGPRGPGHIVKPGIIFTARKLKIPIIPVTTSARPSFLFRSAWDRYLLPFPFGRGVIFFGSPWEPGAVEHTSDVETDCETLAGMLKDLEVRADAVLGKTSK